MSRGTVRIGTSGWTYRHWRGTFYPAGLKHAAELEHYASRFDCAEINGSFYRLPTEAAVTAWRERAPPGFIYAWKAPRYLTHYRRLKDASESVALIYDRLSGLGEKRGPALFQLPPQLKRDDQRLSDFLPLLSGRGRSVFEFRDSSWYAPEIFALLGRHDVALCVSDHAAAPAPWIATASFAYVRGHGPGGRYYGSYDAESLSRWAEHGEEWLSEGRDVFCFFDNDIDAAAPADALRLRDLLQT